jgi:hypothetical protein
MNMNFSLSFPFFVFSHLWIEQQHLRTQKQEQESFGKSKKPSLIWQICFHLDKTRSFERCFEPKSFVDQHFDAFDCPHCTTQLLSSRSALGKKKERKIRTIENVFLSSHFDGEHVAELIEAANVDEQTEPAVLTTLIKKRRNRQKSNARNKTSQKTFSAECSKLRISSLAFTFANQ